MIETMSYFFKYLAPLALALISVAVLSLLNHIISPVIRQDRAVESMEVLAYSILFIGPFFFSISFLFFFYGMELIKEHWAFAKVAFITTTVLMGICLVLDLIFIPKLK